MSKYFIIFIAFTLYLSSFNVNGKDENTASSKLNNPIGKNSISFFGSILIVILSFYFY
jgi:hypothetical protein